MKYVLSDLPYVDIVEILRFLAGEEKPVSCGRFDGEVAQSISQMWRQLPPAEQRTRHKPPFALRFSHGTQEVLYSSISWECNNIWIIDKEVHKYAEFDANSEVAQQLLRLIESVASSS